MRNTVTDRRSPSQRYLRWGLALAALVGAVLSPVTPPAPAAAAVADTVIRTVAGSGAGSASGDGGLATAAGLKSPTGVAVDGAGNTYIADSLNHRIRRIDPSGNIATIAGTGDFGFSGDGGPATGARLSSPKSVTVDPSGNIYIADWGNSRIRRVDTSGKITTVAGGGGAGFSGDGGPATAAKLATPIGVSMSPDGSVLVADTANNRIRRIDTAGLITTVAGGGTAGLGDGGPATAAALTKPTAVIPDSAGGLYVTDAGNSRVRRVDAAGRITTIAGGGAPGSSGDVGDGGQATATVLSLGGLTTSPGLARDPNGDLYVAEPGSQRVRRISPDGHIFTLTGTGAAGFSGDDGPAISARLNQPAGLAVPTSGRVLIADTVNNRIRAVQAPPLAIDDVSVPEGNSGTTAATFTVTVAAHSEAFNVDYATVDGNATAADNDYLPTSGTLHFAPGEWRKTVSVQVVGDTGPEVDETFGVRLTHSPYPDVAGTATIRNDDGPVPVLSIADTRVLEGDTGTTTATFAVTKSGPTTRTVSVDFATADGTATAPNDYLQTLGTIEFGPSDTTKTIGVAVMGDEQPEPDETFTVKLTNPRNAVISTDFTITNPPVLRTLDTGTATILDNDVARWAPESSSAPCPPANESCVVPFHHFGTATRLWAPECADPTPPSWCGDVLVAGGTTSKAELYSPSTGAWVPTGSMLVTRSLQTATLLRDGRVLAVGGRTTTTAGISEAELYDPRAGTWTATGPVAIGRLGHTANLLDDGSVLVVGGTNDFRGQPPTDSVELFDPTTATWHHCTTADAHAGCPAPLPAARVHHATVRLGNGKVLVVGGLGSDPRMPGAGPDLVLPPLSSAVVYNPSTGTWREAVQMKFPRSFPAVALLAASPCGDACGKVMVAGGGPSPSAELYDPVADSWAPAAIPDFEPTAGQDTTAADELSDLGDGRLVLISPNDRSTDVYDPIRHQWTLAHSETSVFGGYAVAQLDTPRCRQSGPPGYCGSVLAVADADASLFHPGPVIRTIDSPSGPSVGGARVVITGGGFSNATVVKFGDMPATDFSVDSATQITATTPSQPSGKVEVSVRTPFGGTSRHFPPDLSMPYSYIVSRAPAAVHDLVAKATSDHTVDLTWPAPASDGTFPPPAGHYVVKISRATIDSDATFAAAPALCGGTCEFNAPSVGSPVTLSVGGLDAGTEYQFALRAVNSAQQSGPLSNQAEARTTGFSTVAAVPTDATPVTTTPPVTAAVPTTQPAPTTAPLTSSTIPTANADPLRPINTPATTVAPGVAAVPAPALTTPKPSPTTTAAPESALGQSIPSAAQTRDRIPTWMWLLLGASLFANIAVLGAVLSRRMHPAPSARRPSL